jgi:hypothetical protein
VTVTAAEGFAGADCVRMGCPEQSFVRLHAPEEEGLRPGVLARVFQRASQLTETCQRLGGVFSQAFLRDIAGSGRPGEHAVMVRSLSGGLPSGLLTVEDTGV